MTNGVVSVVVDGKVAMKLVCGCDGYNAGKVVERIRTLGRVPTARETREIAIACDFGCEGCLVIQEPGRDHFRTSLSERYRAVFNDPEANPRWEHKAEYTEVIQL